jgi:glycosyltransferase involved in cell wall biosynthesis
VRRADDRPKLLVLLASYPYPLETGSAIVVHNNLAGLAGSCDLHVLCRGEPREGGELAGLARRVEFLGRESSLLPRPLRAVRHALRGVPPHIAAKDSGRMRRRAAELLAQGGYDAVLIYEMSAVQCCPPEGRARAIASIEDPQSLRLRRMLSLPVFTPWQRLKMRLAAALMERYERRVLPGLARVILLSEADARDMREQAGHRNLGVVPYGIGPQGIPDPAGRGARTEGMIVFSGNMFHPPNVDGILWFLRESLPLVLARHPAAALWIVGARPDPRIASAAQRFGDRVVITGRVPDVSEHARRALVSICPVRLRIGVQTKVVEALWGGTPVVTTGAGNAGVGGRSGEELWVEDRPEAFGARVAELLRGEGWDRLSQGGRRLAAERFSRARSAAELQRHVEEVRRAGG